MLPVAAQAQPAEASGGPFAAPLGASEAQLRERVGGALQPVEVSLPRSVGEQVREFQAAQRASGGSDAGTTGAAGSEAEARPLFADQQRLALRVGDDPDVVAVEYDLVDERVYRIRWRLGDRFERPIMQALVEHLRARLGEPVLDQTIPAKLGSGRSDLRRTRWQAGDRVLEVRQLHPLTGGPLFVTLSDLAALQRIIDSGRMALPEPTWSGDWWRKPQKPPDLVSGEERGLLLAGVDRVIAGVGFPTPEKGEPEKGEPETGGPEKDGG